jgi:hypothetical protein
MEISAPDQAEESELQPAVGGRRLSAGLQALLWLGIAVLVAGLAYAFWPQSTARSAAQAATPTLTSTLTPTPAALLSPTAPLWQSTRVVSVSSAPTPAPDAIALALTPAPENVGWASSLDGRSHFNFPNIHAGFYNGHGYHGALQFDLSAVPAGSTIKYAALELTGLDDQLLGSGDLWQLNLLDPAVDTAWPAITYNALHSASVEVTIPPALTSADLGRDLTNVFAFEPYQLAALERRLARGVVSFRLDGPTSGNNNLFTWDSGYRSEVGLETKPVLRLVFVPPPVPEYVIMTSTPAPENVVTAAAIAATATEVAATIGTHTPVPENWVTPVIVIPEPTPANAATAAYQARAATAEAFLFGTTTPTPPNVWTATPTPLGFVAEGTPGAGQAAMAGTPQPGAITSGTPRPNYVIVTSVPTPENVITVAAIAAVATQVANAVGTYTPVPENWVTPMVITPQPTPINAATAAYQAAVATAEAFLFGTATPTPINMWTATPTPIFILVDGEVATPFITVTPTATPQPIPRELVGKIAFLSNRSGGSEPLKKPLVYVIDPDGSNLAVLTDRTFYDEVVARDPYSADQRFRTFVKDAIRFDDKRVPAIYFYDYLYHAEEQLTHFGAGMAWDPVWSPTSEQIAFVSNDSQDDEIWVVNRDGSGLRRLTETNEAFNAREIGKDTFIPEVNGQPSWSPDGSQIVFWSNRTGNRQIWVMNADGSNPHSLSTTGHDDWNPVWIKYTDPARDPVPGVVNDSAENR